MRLRQLFINPSQLTATAALATLLCLTQTMAAGDPPAVLVRLPAPQLTSGKPFMETVGARRTTRELKADKLPDQGLANLLWAGFGVNRPGTGQRTAPSAMNSQEIDLYVATPDALYLYDARTNQLSLVAGVDLRRTVSKSAFATNAPVVLIYVADLPRLTKARPERRSFYAAFDAGCISQNIYLYCASANLGTVVFDLDRPPLAQAMKLRPDQEIILAQAVGYPAGQ
jgi:nitroreductase